MDYPAPLYLIVTLYQRILENVAQNGRHGYDDVNDGPPTNRWADRRDEQDGLSYVEDVCQPSRVRLCTALGGGGVYIQLGSITSSPILMVQCADFPH
jgi:hypothetical protein